MGEFKVTAPENGEKGSNKSANGVDEATVPEAPTKRLPEMAKKDKSANGVDEATVPEAPTK